MKNNLKQKNDNKQLRRILSFRRSYSKNDGRLILGALTYWGPPSFRRSKTRRSHIFYILSANHLSVSDSKNGARLEWWVKSLYNDLYHWIRIHYQITKIIFFIRDLADNISPSVGRSVNFFFARNFSALGLDRDMGFSRGAPPKTPASPQLPPPPTHPS